ncbi:Mur ligase [Gammaproteobacteria bacterium]
MNILIALSIGLSCLIFAYRRLLNYLRFFQQEEYDSGRFLQWLINKITFDKKGTSLVVIGLLAQWMGARLYIIAIFLLGGFALLAIYEPDPKKTGKKKLAMTARAKRIFLIGMATLAGLATLLIIYFNETITYWILFIQAIPFSLILANSILHPYETAVQKRFWTEANQKILKYKPITIGITGSYGKTSVKHILGHLLETHAPTLITPGSVNTPMGVARIIREQLSAAHQYFVCEMGAYRMGSITALCDLVSPNYGIITALGMAHYERFKSLDTVCKAKFELAQSVLKGGGMMIIPETILTADCATHSVSENSNQFLVVKTNDGDQHTLSRYCLTAQGIEIEIIVNGVHYHAKVPIHGESHVMNIAVAFTMACQLGMNPEHAVLALSTMPQIQHRFEVKRLSNGVVLIDDAYNSNPEGFRRAVADMSIFLGINGRRILVTPGVVELGKKHDDIHHELGVMAATKIDILIPVLPERIGSLVAGFTKNNSHGIVVPCNNFACAQDWINFNAREGDVILLENDLPDLYEQKPWF